MRSSGKWSNQNKGRHAILMNSLTYKDMTSSTVISVKEPPITAIGIIKSN